ncbi:MAG: hypothetical protein J0H17_00085 [Rhizobiales bacterium]|nr:hypothetical protein [Hyphomicrobiales bacterium]
MISNVMFWTGVIAWVITSFVGLLVMADTAIDWLVRSLWTKREFLMFVAYRLRKRSRRNFTP